MTQSMQAPSSLSVKYRWPEAAFRLKLLTSPFTSTTGGRTDLRISSIRCVSWETDIASAAAGRPETDEATDDAGGRADGAEAPLPDPPAARAGAAPAVGPVRRFGVVLSLKSKKFAFPIRLAV